MTPAGIGLAHVTLQNTLPDLVALDMGKSLSTGKADMFAGGVVRAGVGGNDRAEGRKGMFHISYPAFMTAPRAGIKN